MHSGLTTRIGVDVGGTSIRAAVVDTVSGQPASEVLSAATPTPATAQAVGETVARFVEHLDHPGVVGCALPGVVRHHSLNRAPNLAPDWSEERGVATLSERLGRDLVVLNDADAVGLAEVRFAAGDVSGGLSIVLTFGTGIGSAILSGGVLVEHTELGELSGPHGTFEGAASAGVVEQLRLTPKEWAARAQPYFAELELLLSPACWIIAGGLSSRFDNHFGLIETQAPMRIAHLGEHAGVVGAAAAAADRNSHQAELGAVM